MFADDMVLVADIEQALQRKLIIYVEELKEINVEVNFNKTKRIIISHKEM